jgi:mRNA interferase MazF
MGMVVTRFDVFLVALDPTVGSEIQKTRPCLIISPNEMNEHLATAIIAPMTTKGKLYPSRVPVHFQDKDGLIVLDQIRTVDKTRLVKKLGSIGSDDQKAVISLLIEMFSED